MLVDLLALDVFAVTAKHNMEQKKGTLKSILMYSIINKNNHTLLKKTTRIHIGFYNYQTFNLSRKQPGIIYIYNIYIYLYIYT